MSILDTAAPPPPRIDDWSLRVSKQRIIMFLAVIFLRLLMDYSYATYLSPENEVENHFFNYLNMQKLYESWILMLACTFFLPSKATKPSDFLLFVLFVFPFLSTISLFAFLDENRLYAYALAASFIIIATARNMRLSLPQFEIKGGARWAAPIIFALVLIVAYTYYAILGMDKFQLDIMKVYDVRLAITEELSKSNFLAYVGGWAWTVFVPFLLAWALHYKKLLLLIAVFVLQIYFFGVTSAKTVLFFPALVLVSYFLLSRDRPLAWILYFAFAMTLIGIIEELLTNTFLWNHVLVRRILWDPGRTNWLYYDLFSRIGHVYMSENIFSPIIEYPFPLPPAYMIGLNTYGRVDANADTGFLGTGYMHFGLIGMILFALAVGVLFRLADMLTTNRMPMWMGSAIIIAPFYGLFNDSDLPTTMFTRGMVPALFVLFFYGRFSRDKMQLRAERWKSMRRQYRENNS